MRCTNVERSGTAPARVLQVPGWTTVGKRCGLRGVNCVLPALTNTNGKQQANRSVGRNAPSRLSGRFGPELPIRSDEPDYSRAPQRLEIGLLARNPHPSNNRTGPNCAFRGGTCMVRRLLHLSLT